MADTNKKPYKVVELAINNFKEAIPYHKDLSTVYKEKFSKRNINDLPGLCADVKRSMTHIKNLLYELDTLRTQVIDGDLDKFDVNTLSLRKELLQISKDYTDLSKSIESFRASKNNSYYLGEEESEQGELKHLQLEVNINDIKLREKEARLQDVEAIQSDIQDLHSTYGMLHTMVHEQGELVDTVENNVVDAQENVNAGVKQLAKCSRIKTSMYPVAGAVVGACMIGPLGFIAGLKVGGITALGCGLLGYTGGAVLKNSVVNESQDRQEKVENVQDNAKNKVD